jgi:hypothetical protein
MQCALEPLDIEMHQLKFISTMSCYLCEDQHSPRSKRLNAFGAALALPGVLAARAAPPQAHLEGILPT